MTRSEIVVRQTAKLLVELQDGLRQGNCEVVSWSHHPLDCNQYSRLSFNGRDNYATIKSRLFDQPVPDNTVSYT